MEKTIDELLAIADELGWGLQKETYCWRFSAYSPAGQDFSFTIEIPENSHEMICDLYNDIANYSPFEEAMLWVKNGHGVNGAPDDPADIFADMEDCKGMMQELLDAWKQL